VTGVKRGDVVTISAPGDFGKPRPAVIVQTDHLNADHASIIVCPLTSHVVDAPLLRITVEPAPENGLARPSQIMADKLLTLRREKVGSRIGHLDAGIMERLERSLLFVLGFARKNPRK